MNPTITKLANTIRPLVKHERNTTYEVHIIRQTYSQQINVFFEWGRIGRATVSRQVGIIPLEYSDQLTQLARQLGQATQLRVNVD